MLIIYNSLDRLAGDSQHLLLSFHVPRLLNTRPQNTSHALFLLGRFPIKIILLLFLLCLIYVSDDRSLFDFTKDHLSVLTTSTDVFETSQLSNKDLDTNFKDANLLRTLSALVFYVSSIYSISPLSINRQRS